MFSDDELSEQLALVLDVAPPEPPADRIAALRARAESSHAPQRSRRAARWLAAAAAVVAVAGGVIAVRAVNGGGAGVVEFDGGMAGPDGEQVAADLRVVATGVGRVIELDTDALPVLPAGELYEVWFVGPGDTPDIPNRISAGTFHPDQAGRTDVRLTAAVDPSSFPVVEVTAEPGDGDPRPSGSAVLRAVIGG